MTLFFFSFRTYFYITRWSTAASATTRKANASLASTGTRQKTATKWNAVRRLLKHTHTRSQPRRWRNYRDSKHTNAVPTYKHYSCLILVLISRQNVPDWLITSRRTKRRTAIKTTTSPITAQTTAISSLYNVTVECVTVPTFKRVNPFPSPSTPQCGKRCLAVSLKS